MTKKKVARGLSQVKGDATQLAAQLAQAREEIQKANYVVNWLVDLLLSRHHRLASLVGRLFRVRLEMSLREGLAAMKARRSSKEHPK